MKFGKSRKALEKRFNDKGTPRTRKEIIEDRIANGWTIKDGEFQGPDGRVLTEQDLTITGRRYAEHLLNNDKPAKLGRKGATKKPSPEPTGEQVGNKPKPEVSPIGDKTAAEETPDSSPIGDATPPSAEREPTTDDDADAMMDGILGDMEDSPKTKEPAAKVEPIPVRKSTEQMKKELQQNTQAIDDALETQKKELGSQKAKLQRSSKKSKQQELDALEQQWTDAQKKASDQKQALFAAHRENVTKASDYEQLQEAQAKQLKDLREQQSERDAENAKQAEVDSREAIDKAGGYEKVKAELEAELRDLRGRKKRTNEANQWKIDSQIDRRVRDLERIEKYAPKESVPAKPAPEPPKASVAPDKAKVTPEPKAEPSEAVEAEARAERDTKLRERLKTLDYDNLRKLNKDAVIQVGDETISDISGLALEELNRRMDEAEAVLKKAPHVAAFRAALGDDYANRLGADFDRYFNEFDSLDEDTKNREYRANERRGKSFQSELGAKVTYAGTRVGLLGDGMQRVMDAMKQEAKAEKPAIEVHAGDDIRYVNSGGQEFTGTVKQHAPTGAGLFVIPDGAKNSIEIAASQVVGVERVGKVSERKGLVPDVTIGAKSNAGNFADDIVRRTLQREQDKGNPAWFYGSHIYTVSGKYAIEKDAKSRQTLTKLHELTQSGLTRQFSLSEYISYNRAVVELHNELTGAEEAKAKELQAKEQAERDAADKVRLARGNAMQTVRDEAEKIRKSQVDVAVLVGSKKEKTKGVKVGEHLAVTKIDAKTNQWRITHLPSGMAIQGSYSTRQQAIEAGWLVNHELDWSQAKPARETIDEARKRLAWYEGKLETVPTFLKSTDEAVTTGESQQPLTKSEQTKAKANEKREQARQDESDFGRDVGNTLGITATGVPLAGPHRGMGKSIQHFFQRFFTSQGELPADVYDSKVRKEGRVAQEMNRLRQRATDFRRAIKKALGGKELTQADIERMNEVLRGDALPSTLPVELRAPIKAMRDHIDALSSQLILEGVAQGDLVGIITESMGVYATRSYRVFDNPKWRDQVPDAVRNRAVAAIRALDPSKSDAEVAGILESLLYRGAADTPVALLKGSKLGSKDLTSFMARKEIPEWLRELWGEYKDAGVNYARSVFKMAHLLANQQFLNEVREAGLGKWLRTKEDGPIINEYGEIITPIAADASSVMEPLNGLLTTPEIKKAFERFDSPGAMPEWLRMFMVVNYSVKYGKTVGSVMTHVRNMVSNAGFAVANGHWRVGKAVNAAWGTATGTFQLSNEKFRTYYNHLAELGLVGEDVRAGELQDALRDASQADIDEFLYNAEARHAKKVVGFGRAVFRGLNSLYQAEDAVWKIYAWENEKARYSKAHPEWSEQQVEEHAAKIVRDTYPTYSKIPEGIKALRRFPVLGTFVSFPSEVVRTTFHTIKLGIEEMQSPETRAIGAQRLAGTVVSIGILSVLSRGMMALFGIDNDDDEDLRWFVAPYQENSRFVYMGKPKDATFHFVDLGYSDPHAYLTDSVVAFMRGKDWKDSLVKSTSEFLSPFASQEILFKAGMEAIANEDQKVYNEHDEIGEQAKGIVAHMWTNAFEPGTFTSGRRIITAIGGTDPSKSVRDEVLAVTTGQRLQKVDVEHSLGFRVRDFNKTLTAIQGIARNTVTSRGTATGAMVATDLARMEKLRLAAFSEMQQIAGAARRLGVPEESIRTLMKAELPNDVAEQLMTGDYSAYKMTPQTVRQMMDVKPEEFKQRFEAWHGQKTPEAIQSYIGPRLAGLDKDSDLKKIKSELELLGVTFAQAEQALKDQWKSQYGSAYENGVLKAAVQSRRNMLVKIYETK